MTFKGPFHHKLFYDSMCMKQAEGLCCTSREPSVRSGLPATSDVKDCPRFTTFQCLKFLNSKGNPDFLCSSLSSPNFILGKKLILKDVTGPEISQMTYRSLMGTATGRDFPFLQIPLSPAVVVHSSRPLTSALAIL